MSRSLPYSRGLRQAAEDYLEVVKLRETGLITFIGAGAVVIAAAGSPPLERLGMATMAILLGAAGVNGLTNYLDREVDARMERTRHRALPSRRIYPAERALPWVGGLTVAGLLLGWLLHPLVFLSGFIGTVAALVGRKSSATHLLGGISGAAPVAAGWFTLDPRLSPALLFLLLLVLVWVPLHVWSLMLAYRGDYLNAGVHVFPVSWRQPDAVRVLAGLVVLLYLLSWWGYLGGFFGALYLVVANLLGAGVLLSGLRLWRSGGSRDAWRLYRILTYPYLGVIFLAMMLDVRLG